MKIIGISNRDRALRDLVFKEEVRAKLRADTDDGLLGRLRRGVADMAYSSTPTDLLPELMQVVEEVAIRWGQAHSAGAHHAPRS